MRKYFMELFAMGFVDSEGNLVEENVLRDAQRTAALTAKDYEGEYRQHMGNGISFKPDILCMADLFRYDFFKIHYVYHRKRSCLRRRTLMDGGRSPG